jgi:PAS domain S-box-containing protein
MTMLPDGDMPPDLLRTLAELSSDAIIVADGEMKILAFNRAALDIFGFSASEMRGKSVLDMVPVPARQGMQARLGTRLCGSNPAIGKTFHSKFTRPDGKVIDVEHVVNSWESGGKPYFGAIIRDISEWVLAKEAIEESEEKFRNVAEQSPNMIFINFKGTVVYANRRCEELMGYTREDFLLPSFDFMSITAPEYRALVGEKFARHSKGLDVEPYEYAIIARDGRRLDTILSTKLISYRGEKAILGTITDITGRKRAEEAIRSSEEKYRLVSENIPVAVYSALPDEHSTNIFISGRIRDLTGYGADELMNDPALWSNLIHPDDRAPVWKLLNEHRRLKQPFDATYRINTKHGKMKWIRDRATPRLDERGEIIRIDGFMEDVSEQKRAEEALRASEEKYRELVENVNDVIYSVGLDGTISYVSPSVERVIGYTPAELLGKRFPDLVYKDDLSKTTSEFRRRVDGVVELAEYRLVAKDGALRWVNTTSRQLRSGDRVVGLTGILTDVTERKNAESAIRESEEKYRELVESVSEVIYSVDLDGTINYVSPSIERVVGYRPEELLGKRFAEFIHKDDVQKMVSEVRRRVGGVVEPSEYRIVARDGGLRWISTTSRQLKSGDRVIGLTGILTDVTGRKNAESAIRESEERYRSLFENSPEGVVLLDLDGRVLDLNRAALTIMGLPREMVVGKKFIEQGGIYEDDIPRFMDIFGRMARGELAHPVEIRLRTPKGDRWEEVFPALLEKDGDVFALQVIMRDVTDRRKTQREMMARLMEYELEEGNLYLVKEAAPVLSVQAFQDLLKAGYRGAVLSRTPAQRFRADPGQQFDFRWISEKESAHTLSPDLAGIERWLDGLPRNMALLVDRLDYLMLRNGFEPTLRFVHRLRDLAYINGHVVILSLDPASVGVREMHSLDREALEIAPRARPKLPDDLYDVLRHVYQQGAIGQTPTLTELRRDLDLSKPTTAKRVMNLVRGGYLALSARGRTKQVEITEKGRRVFLK